MIEANLTVAPEILARQQARAAAQEEANAMPLPGPLLEAFWPEPARLAGLELQPVVASHLGIMQKIGSPVWQQMREASKPAEERQAVDVQVDDVIEMLYVFTRPVGEIRAVLRKGREAFAEAAQVAVGEVIPPGLLGQAEAALIRHLESGFATHVGHEAASGSGEGEGTVFTRPPAERKTGSAGGLNGT